MRAAVVGHVEWVEFARVDHVPPAGEIVHASETLQQPAGGGAVAAVQLAKLAGEATLFTALGDDDLGHRAATELAGLGVRVEAAFRPQPQRRAFTFVDDAAERTITVIGKRLAPRGDDPLAWAELEAADGVYFTAGDAGALRAARGARALVATPRAMPTLVAAGVELDALVASAADAGEQFARGRLDPPPRLVVRTAGSQGGAYELEGGECGSYAPAEVAGSRRNAYGCGDSFAAALTFGLGSGLGVEEALALAARAGAACFTGRDAYEGQLVLRS